MRFCKQATFDIVVLNLRRQGVPSVEKSCRGNCAYRGEGGNKCAAGWLIPDDAYTVDMEGQLVIDTTGKLTKVGETLAELGHDAALACVLQEIHDASDMELESDDKEAFLEAWERDWRRLAAREGLVYTDAAGVSHF